MSQTVLKFIGRAILLDPATKADTESSVCVCLLLIGEDKAPGITVCQTENVDQLLAKLKIDDLYARFKDAKVTYDPPPGDWPVNHSARQRYDALTLDEINRAQTFLSGR